MYRVGEERERDVGRVVGVARLARTVVILPLTDGSLSENKERCSDVRNNGTYGLPSQYYVGVNIYTAAYF